MSFKVLVLEDEIGIRSFVSINLKRGGYEVIEAPTGEEAIEKVKTNKIDIALLDVMLPGISGIQVCEFIRENYDNIGIIMLTAKGQENDKIIGLNSGADDYIVKPFSPKELLARINALLRRLKKDNSQNQLIICDPFTLDLSQRKLFKEDREIEITPTEFSIIKYLIKNEGKSISRDELLDAIWGKNYIGDLKIVDVNIRRIRSKIEENPSKPKYLQTVWGYGYCLRKED
ncbi:response regulator transcription factor [Tepidibacter formicigenes]|jgi:DNA-binding response OmpR family regulator|uniref:Stage 0 sporulation protein A homolog n=1 Tax=Tepidibacter formicigenes DSM 15518 TaxID=1123349 RepID=A0A1M6M634_9FIRM|nr:response regulator transcription factor [Tepidibacter formicigenes]SHJ78897.1 DNA-binding response regulator, OmpR family, contains REC and winged-helix (wHTH) domain [Tepidibacter formicigenes DSM 15518]